MKKKLLVTASTFPRWEGDTEPRFVLDLSKALSEYFDVTVLVPGCPGAKEEEVLDGVKVIRYHYFPIHQWETLCYPGAIVPRIKEKKVRILLVPFLFLGLWWKLFRILKNYDVVHAHWIIPQGIVQSFFKKDYIVTGHGGDVLELNAGILRIFKRRVLTKAKAVTVVSNRLKNKIQEMYHINNVYVQSMGCDFSKFSTQKRIENYFNQQNKKVILFVGRFVKIKGIEYLIEAMGDIDAKLVVVGKGPLEEELKRKAKKFEDKILFMEAQGHETLSKVYASSDIFVIPSITLEGGVTEGTPTVISEAMASGLPVIGTKTGGIPEVIQNGKNGFLIEEQSSKAISEKINLILKNQDLYQKLQEGALKTADKYDYTVVAKNFYKILGGN